MRSSAGVTCMFSKTELADTHRDDRNVGGHESSPSRPAPRHPDPRSPHARGSNDAAEAVFITARTAAGLATRATTSSPDGLDEAAPDLCAVSLLRESASRTSALRRYALTASQEAISCLHLAYT